MILERKETKKDNGDIVIEGYYDSSNIIKTMYVPSQSHLFIFFKNKHVYSYSGIDKELFENFEKAESQGKFFVSEIRNKSKEYNYFREYKLYDFEQQDIMDIIEQLKATQKPEDKNIL